MLANKIVTILAYGTFCDIKICITIAKYLANNGFIVHFITNSLPKELKYSHNYIQYIIIDINKYLDLSDSSIANSPNNLKKVLKLSPLIYYIKANLGYQINNYVENCDYLLIHYPALLYCAALNLKNIKNIGVFYVAPAYPNKSIPYIFSEEIVDYRPETTFPGGFSPTPKKSYTSSITESRLLASTSGDPSKINKILEVADMILLWDPSIFPAPLVEIAIPFKPVLHLTNLVDIETELIPDEQINKFAGKSPLAYVSLGSFIVNEGILKVIKSLFTVLINMGFKVFYQDKNAVYFADMINAGNLLVRPGFVQHEWLIPKCKLLVSSGSYCMVSLAYYYGVKILHIPVVYEQLFWAKTYAYNTNTEFINTYSKVQYTEEVIQEIINCFGLQNIYTPSYLTTPGLFTSRIQKSMRNTSSANYLVKFISQAISTVRTQSKMKKN